VVSERDLFILSCRNVLFKDSQDNLGPLGHLDLLGYLELQGFRVLLVFQEPQASRVPLVSGLQEYME